LPRGVRLAGLGFGKPNHIITIHLLKAAAKQARLDEAQLRKRSATRGDTVVDVKPGDSVTGVTEPWSVERYLTLVKKEAVPDPRGNGRKPASNRTNGTKPTPKKAPVTKKPAPKKPVSPKSKTPAKKTSTTTKSATVPKKAVKKKPATKKK
jgi:hypothetical protein